MKRLFAMFLVISIVVSYMTLGIVYGAEDYSYKYGDMQLAKDVMAALDVVSYTEETANDTVSRIDFAIYLGRLLKIDEYVKTNKYYFDDVDNNYYGCAVVNTLCEMGIISQNEERLFYPDKVITKAEISKMLLSVLGYKEYAEVKGGYPNGYMSIASKSDIFKGVGAKETFTVSEIALILMNAASVSMYSPIVYSQERIEYAVNKEQTIFSLYHNIYVEYDILNSAETVSLNESCAGEGRVIIGSNIYYSDKYYGEYLGEMVYGYYYSLNGDQRDLFYIRPSDKQIVENFTSKEYSDYKDNVFSYYKGDSKRETKRKTDNTTVFMKNGEVLLYDIENEMDISFGFYKLIDSDRNGIYETVIVEEVETMVVDTVDSISGVIYDKKAVHNPIDIDKYLDGTVLIYDTNGNVLNKEDILANDILSVVRNESNYLKITVSKKTVTSLIKSVRIKDDIMLVTEDKTYELADSYINYGEYIYKNENGSVMQIIKLSENYILRLDAFGRVAYIDMAKDISEYLIGYVIGIKKSENEFDDQLALKLLCEDRDINIFDCIENIKVDGVKKKNVLDLQAYLSSANKVIRFKINDDNKIYDIDTSFYDENRESKESLRCTREYDRTATALTYMASTDLFGSTHLMDDSTVVFNVPGNDIGVKDRDYSFGAMSQFMDQTGYNIETYKIGDEPGTDDIIVYRQDNSKSDETVRRSIALIVSEISETVNADGDVVKSISGYQSGSYITFMLEADFDETASIKNFASDKVLTLNDIDRGDIIKIGKNSYDEIDKIQYYLDGDNIDATKWAPCNAEFNDRGRQELAYCLRKNGTIIEWSYELGGEISGIIDLNTTKVIIYDKNDERTPFRVGSVNDIISYESATKDCSRLYIGAYVTKINTVIIYR